MIELENITKIYRRGSEKIEALSGISLNIGKGEALAVTGSSGSGKTTLMNIIGCLDKPTAGTYRLFGSSVTRLGAASVSCLRRSCIGFVFQDFNLIPHMTALANVELPLMISGVPVRERRHRALEALEAVGLSDRVKHLPPQLSGGQMQRVAIARVLAADTPLIVADEPTGNLDSAAAASVAEILRGLNRTGKTVIIITHDAALAGSMPRVIGIDRGKLSEGAIYNGKTGQDQLLS